jgi:hypothetical protein
MTREEAQAFTEWAARLGSDGGATSLDAGHLIGGSADIGAAPLGLSIEDRR